MRTVAFRWRANCGIAAAAARTTAGGELGTLHGADGCAGATSMAALSVRPALGPLGDDE